MRRYLTVLLLVLAGLGIAGPADAAAGVKMSFVGSPGQIASGATITLSGRVWRNPTGNRTRVNFFFQKSGTQAYVLAGFVNADDRGYFVKRVPARTTGTWKASALTTARLDSVQVVQRRPRQVAVYSYGQTDWQGPRINLATAEYRAVATYRCGDEGYFYLGWNGDRYGYESASSDRPSGTVTLNGHQGARGGYFEISTWTGCSWNVKIYAGTVLVAV